MGRRTPRAIIAALLAGAGAALSSPAGAGAMVMLYDTASSVRGVVQGQGALSPAVHDVYQQQPVTAVLGPRRQAWKVSARGPSRATPGLRGRSAEGMAALLADRVRRSGARLVFIDEAGIALHRSGEDASNLAIALALLRGRTVPGLPAGQSVADRVHIYVQGVPAPLVRPQRWAATWRVLALAGGVWWQSYTSNRPWSPAEWATWGPLVQRRLAEAGGDPSRLRWMVRHHPSTTLADQFASMLSGASCTPVAHGVGAWRVGVEATAFRDLWSAVRDGRLGCAAAPAVGPDAASGLRETLALANGATLPEGALILGAHGIGRVEAGSVPLGVPVRLRLDLGADPLGVAGRLGVEPAEFWATAGAVLSIRGPGVDQRHPVVPGLALDTYISPRTTGRVQVRLIIPGRSLRGALGGERVDLLGTVEAAGGAPTAALARRLALSPGGFAHSIPLRSDAGVQTIPVVPGPGAVARRAQMVLPGRLLGGRIAPAHLRPLAVRLRGARGDAVEGARVLVRLPGGRILARRSGPDGIARLAIPRRAGVHVARVPGTRIRVVRRLGPPARPDRATRRR
ncbi:MAG: hypothetical protein RIB67_11505 [Miltoncostaeaceae bacterium]